MFTFIDSSLQFIQNNPITMGYVSGNTQKYAKIMGVALAILGTVTALYLIYRHFKPKKVESEESVIPHHISPKPVKDDLKKTSLGNQGKKDPVDQGKKIPTQEKLDEEFARKLEQQLLEEDLAQIDAKQSPPKLSPVPVNPPTPISPKSPSTTESPQPRDEDMDSPSLEKPKAQPTPFTQIEEICGKISEKIFSDSSFSAVKALSAIDPNLQNQILGLVNEIVTEFEKRNPYLHKVRYGDQVPAYFANVAGFQSTEERKYLSLVGIRNLLKYGPTIIDDFRKTKFLGGELNYGAKEGLNSFKYYTGNTVDLDIEFDATSDAEALKEAEKNIIDFGKKCGLMPMVGLNLTGGGKLTADEVARQLPRRKLGLPKSWLGIHTSIDHTDRSNHGIWKRVNPKTNKINYYANVPNCDIVVLATLRMPYLLAELAYHTKEKNHGKLPKEFFDQFFKNGLSDMCFNEKARTLMTFYHTWMAELDGEVTDPHEDARRKLAKGAFGEALKKKDPNTVLKEAFTSMSLMNILTNDYAVNGRPYDQYVKEEQAKLITELKTKGQWEAALYHKGVDADYFLLNQSSLNVFMKDLYEFMQYM